VPRLEVAPLISADCEVPSTEAVLTVIELDFREDPRWEAFVSSHPDALIYHHSGWLSALESEYGQECITLACVDEKGGVCAVLPLFRTKGLPVNFGPLSAGRRLSSLPRTPIAGPLATSLESAKAIVQHAVELVRAQPGMQLELKTKIADLDKSVSGLICLPWRPTYTAELPVRTEGAVWEDFWETLRVPRNCVTCKDCRRLRFGNARRQHRVNWSVNKAIKLGLEVRDAESEEELAVWYQLYLLTMRHNAVPPRPFRLFQNLWSSLRPAGKMRLLLAEQNAGESRTGQKRLVAGSILLQFGQTVFYAFTGCAPADFNLHPHDILQIEAIRSACKSGFRWYDFGEVTEDHEALAQFKTKWGGDPKQLYRYYYPAPSDRASGAPCDEGRLSRFARKVWRHLPPKATAVLGDLIYRRM
jgi:Acetyltransferase (GNAT) domain